MIQYVWGRRCLSVHLCPLNPRRLLNLRGRMALQSCVNSMKRAENTTLGYPGVQDEALRCGVDINHIHHKQIKAPIKSRAAFSGS